VYNVKRANQLIQLLLHLFLIAVALASLVPFLWMLSTSFKEFGKIFIFPPEWIPNPFVVESYVKLFTLIPFFQFLWNTIFITVTVTTGQLIFSSMGAYAFARLKFPGRDLLFLAYLGTMMVPSQVTMIPSYILMSKLHWVDTYHALIIPHILGSAFATFLLRQFFMTIPRELEDAAYMDGCNRVGIYWRIILPLSKPALATLGVFVFLFMWNDFMWPLVVTNSDKIKTLTVGLATLSVGYFGTDWPTLMAGSVLSILPILILFLFLQRYFIEGITLTGLKG
jgi:multiple sugar transport system permease protein